MLFDWLWHTLAHLDGVGSIGDNGGTLISVSVFSQRVMSAPIDDKDKQTDTGCSLTLFEELVKKAEFIARCAFEATMTQELNGESLNKFDFEPNKLTYLGKRKFSPPVTHEDNLPNLPDLPTHFMSAIELEKSWRDRQVALIDAASVKRIRFIKTQPHETSKQELERKVNQFIFDDL